ncbi:hypothetical protein [Paenibacillus faecalis]|nr:hypothetical protein [Paenibacillus faecalis]
MKRGGQQIPLHPGARTVNNLVGSSDRSAFWAKVLKQLDGSAGGAAI